jgi:predicted phosphodiesterase
MRVFALSDIHVDYPDNMAWVQSLSKDDYTQDILLLAGDVCHELGKFEEAVCRLREKFAQVFFVPGNHDLWLLQGEFADSIEKFHRLLDICCRVGIATKPAKAIDNGEAAWIVPLFSWYTKPENGLDSLFLPMAGGDRVGMDSWGDEHFVRWGDRASPAQYFLGLNARNVELTYDAPVISFSHFLPRIELLFPPEYLAAGVPTNWPLRDGFNFSRVAGTRALDQQIRRLGSFVHVYGHQHRNRWVAIDGTLYVSHCLGYPHERKSGRIGYFGSGPRLIWPLPS